MESPQRQIAIIATGCLISLCLGMVTAIGLRPSYDPANEHWGPRLELVSAAHAGDLRNTGR
jgi:hypothetical protein